MASLWLLARPSLYRLPAGLPFLRLGETLYREPWAPRGASRAAASAVVVSLGLAERDQETRDRNTDMPFAKPRFALKDGVLELMNVPLLTPDSVVRTGSIQQLPFVPYEQSFQSNDWQWRFYHHSYAIRLIR